MKTIVACVTQADNMQADNRTLSSNHCPEKHLVMPLKPKVIGIFGRRGCFKDVDSGKKEMVEYVQGVSAQCEGNIVLLTSIPNDGVAKLTLEVSLLCLPILLFPQATPCHQIDRKGDGHPG